MSRFRATIKGSRGEASRLGTAESGITTETNGWNVGVRVDAHVNDAGQDLIEIYANGGSNGGTRQRAIALLRSSENSVDVMLLDEKGNIAKTFKLER